MDPIEVWTPYRDTKFCFVPACKNNSRNSTKTFFVVPKSSKQAWCDAVGVECPLKRYLHICEDHLNLQEDMENYMYWKTMRVRPKLKTRVPQSLLNIKPSEQNLHLFNEPGPSTSTGSYMEVDVEDTGKRHKGVQVKPKMSDRTTYCAIHKKQRALLEDDETKETTSIEEPSTQGSSTSADISETSDVNVPSVRSSFQGRNFMLNLVKNKPQCYIGLPKNYYWLIEYLESNVNIKSFDTIITLYKIRSNIPFYQISDIFEVSLTTIWRIFIKSLYILAQFFKKLIFTPSQFEVKGNLPSSFTTNKEYSNVFCIIDCFEIEIEKPSNPINQSLTWSQYKNANTLKYLVATTPDGFVNFVSAGYGGRTSDIKIIESSGFLDVLPPNCTILADRGFKHRDITHRVGIVEAEDFGYDGNIGPLHWGERYRECAGKHQSPININVLHVKQVTLPDLVLVGFDDSIDNVHVTNNGHTVLIEVKNEPHPRVRGGPLDGDYIFSQMHFHWGDNDTIGSEDKINHRSFPMELHMVFFKEDYKTNGEAVKHSDGLTVLAFFYELDRHQHPAYDEITSALVNVTEPHTSVVMSHPFSFLNILPYDLKRYFTYRGSLTTPPCSEVVIWLDFEQPIRLEHEQIEAFREIRSAHGKITHNFRPIQPIGDRVVFYNIESNYYVYNEIEEHEETTTRTPSRRKKHRNEAFGVVSSTYTLTLLCILSLVL